MTGFKTIKAVDLREGCGLILDVRTKMEHDEKHIAMQHRHEPLDGLDAGKLAGVDKSSPVVLLCRSGKRAAQAAERLIADGFSDVSVVEGGIMACEDCGQKIKGYGATPSAACPRKRLSLERQVRIVAGVLAATGAALALWVSPSFAWLSLAVGAGLAFAGVTDRCGVALLLAHAPWNK